MDYIKKFKSPENMSFFTTFVIGYATHLFGFVNVIHNYDDIAIAPIGSGTGVISGRWLLTILDNIFQNIGITYNLPYINAILFILLISVSVKYLIRILEIKNRVSAILIGAVFVAFPSATGTLFFKYTTILYGIAILCAVLAVWCIKRFKYGFILSIFLIACSLGIYQAYVPITISLMVILLLRDNLAENSKAKDIVRQGLKYVVTLVLGVIAYYILLKICLIAYDAQLIAYQGIDKMGAIEPAQWPSLLKRTLFGFCSIIAKDYSGVSQTPIIRLGIIILGCICAGLIIFILRVHRKRWDAIVLTALLCAMIPFAINFVVIMCPASGIYTLMVYSFALVFTLPFVLLELIEPLQFSKKYFSDCRNYIKRAVLIVTSVIFISYAYLANLNYTQLYYATKVTENYMTSFVLQVRMTEGFEPTMQWAFIGDDFQDPLFHYNWEWVPKYGGNATASSLINSYSRLYWINNYFGYAISLVDEERLSELKSDTEVMNMPCFPSDGSIRVIDDVIVIKLESVE